jgi:hypothetical protein
MAAGAAGTAGAAALAAAQGYQLLVGGLMLELPPAGFVDVVSQAERRPLESDSQLSEISYIASPRPSVRRRAPAG